MFFTLLVLVAALALESLGSYISVVGLSQNTSVIIIFLAVLLDFVKVIIATTLYKKWGSIHLVLKSFLLPALLGLMLVTSSGTYGYLIKEFGKTSVGQEEIAVKVNAMQEEKERIEARKKEIDSQIAALPANSVLQRKRLTDLFSTELNQINARILELDKAIPEANLQSVQSKSNSGNLASIASTYGMKPEDVNKIVAFLITLMIDPLAIVLLTISNFLMEQGKKEKRENAIKILKGEMVLDDDSLMQQLKNKMRFMKSKTAKDDLDVSKYLHESKPHLVKEAIMTKMREKIKIVNFIDSSKLIENPKLVVPIKYSASIFQLLNFVIFRESRPEIIKVAPEKSFKMIETTNFITEDSEILPTYVVTPLKRIRREFVEEEMLFSNEAVPVVITEDAEKQTLALNVTDFISVTQLVEPTEPFSLDKKEYIEEALFISSEPNDYKPVVKETIKTIPTHFITEVQEVQIQKLQKEHNQIEIDNFLNAVEASVEELEHDSETAPVHEFLLKDKPTAFKVVHKETVQKQPEVEVLKKPIFKKPVIKITDQLSPKIESSYSISLEHPIEYTEPVIFHDEFEDFQIADLGDLVMQLWEQENAHEQQEQFQGFDIKEILNMEEIEV